MAAGSPKFPCKKSWERADGKGREWTWTHIDFQAQRNLSGRGGAIPANFSWVRQETQTNQAQTES